MFQSDQAMQLAKRLHTLKARTNRSYEALARRVGVSSSTLHRYCRGETVPAGFEVIARFGQVCGASSQEAAELLQYWALAVRTGHESAAEVTPSRRRLWLSVVVLGAVAAGSAVVRRRRARAGHV